MYLTAPCGVLQIWFQNRRRKDIVGSKGKKESSAPEPSTSRMVPDDVMQGVLNELVRYDTDPTGKLGRTADKPPPPPPPVSVAAGSDVSAEAELPDSSASPEVQLAGPLPDSSVEICALAADPKAAEGSAELDSGHVVKRCRDVEVPTLAQLDMIAPPNVVAPHADIAAIKSSLRSLDAQIESDAKRLKFADDWKSSDSVSTTSAANDDQVPIGFDGCFPPNRSVDSAEPLRFYHGGSVSVAQPLSVCIPAPEAVQVAPPVSISQCFKRHPPQLTTVHTAHAYQQSGAELKNHATKFEELNYPTMMNAAGYTDVVYRHPTYVLDRAYPYHVIPTDNPPRLAPSTSAYSDHFANYATASPAFYHGDSHQPIRLQHFAANPYFGYDVGLSNFVAVADKKRYTDL